MDDRFLLVFYPWFHACHPVEDFTLGMLSISWQFLPNGSRVFPLFILLVTIGLSYASIFLSFYSLYVSSLLYTLLFPLLRLVFLQLLASQQTSVNSWRSSDRSISTFPFLLSSQLLLFFFISFSFIFGAAIVNLSKTISWSFLLNGFWLLSTPGSMILFLLYFCWIQGVGTGNNSQDNL